MFTVNLKLNVVRSVCCICVMIRLKIEAGYVTDPLKVKDSLEVFWDSRPSLLLLPPDMV